MYFLEFLAKNSMLCSLLAAKKRLPSPDIYDKPNDDANNTCLKTELEFFYRGELWIESVSFSFKHEEN